MTEDEIVCWRCGSTETIELYFEDGRTEFSVTVCAECGNDEP